ncbi:MAG TPA: inositol monophosphatase family protein, partial [Acidimicrobiales bacterium]|nr:inositol monophosphatase family protein [Acidimicrobiales bacterium]
MTADAVRRFDSWEPAEAFGLDGAGGPAPEGLRVELAAVALKAAQQAGVILEKGAPGRGNAVSGVETKISSTDMVSDVDRESEAAITQVLAAARPDDAVLGEEGTERPGTTGVTWVVDPLDGTTNFLFGIPQWSVSIAAEIDGRPVAGVVVDPPRHEVWAAIAGHGAFLNGRRCRVRDDRSTLDTALVATG